MAMVSAPSARNVEKTLGGTPGAEYEDDLG